ncbi:MAG: NAD-dependent malic enzyme [Christensenellaceae bacterium]|nr:NAD-dependent malic enzyme [Christensenellaceae bacterium]
MDIYQKSLKFHEELQGKIDINVKCKLDNKQDLSLAYTPGVAESCRQIYKNPDDVYKYTWKNNIVAVISDGTAVLGLGDIGPEAALPVMEGKAALFKKFADVNAIPIVLNTKNTDKIISTIKAIAPTFGGINLEDISAPRCVEIERILIEELDIPVFHDDQHGTAIVVTAAFVNSLKLVKKEPKDIKLVVSGTGAAGSSIIKMLYNFGIKNIYAFNINGILNKKYNDSYDFLNAEIADITNPDMLDISLAQAMEGADAFVGVSAPNVVNKAMVSSMAKNAIVFAMANPEPEISYDDAVSAGAVIVGTGRSDYPNQINNVLAFPGLFKGALQVRARKISEGMKLAAAIGIAKLAEDEGLSFYSVIPSAFNPKLADVVANEVAKKAVEEGLSRL